MQQRADDKSPNGAIEAGQLIRWTKAEAWPGNPGWLDTLFSPASRDERLVLGGGGLYAIFLDGKLLYVGIFVGPANDLFGGSVLKTRWLKHIGTLTMRGRNVSIRANALPLLREPGAPSPLAMLRAATDNADAPLLKSQGMEMSRRKMAYAAEHWDIFSAPMGEIFSRISFGYARLHPAEGARWRDKKSLSKALKTAEAAIVGRFAPPLNTEHNPHPRPAHASVDAVMPMLRAEIDRLIGRAAPALAPVAALLQASVVEAEEMEDMPEAFETFAERLSPAGASFFDDFSAAIRNGEHFLYATHDGEQIRFCAKPDGARKHPLLLLEWGQRGENANRFKARTRLAPDSVERLGFKPVATSDPQMACAFNFDPTAHSWETLVVLCRAAVA